MDIPNFFKNFFGFNRMHDNFKDNRNQDDIFGFNMPRESDEEEFNSIFKNDSFEDFHRIFESQMNKIFQSLGSFDFTGSAEFSDSMFPAIKSDIDPRSQLLKPGYESTSKHDPDNQIIDKDLDDKIKANQIRELFDQNETDKKEIQPNRNMFFSRSIISRTIRQPDGTYVTEKIVRDNDGNEETTITHHGSQGESPEDRNLSEYFPFKFFKY